MYIYEDFYSNFFEKKKLEMLYFCISCVCLGMQYWGVMCLVFNDLFFVKCYKLNSLVYIKKNIYSINKKINKEKIICERFYLNK